MTIRVEFFTQDNASQNMEPLALEGRAWLQTTQGEDGERAYLLGLRGVTKQLVCQIESCIERGLVSEVIIEEGEVAWILYPVDTEPMTKLVGVKFEKNSHDQNAVKSTRVSRPKEKNTGWSWSANLKK